MILTPAARFTQALEAQGIPVHGVSGSDATARIDFKDEATPQQRLAARNAADNFDWTDRPARTVDEIEVDLSNLTAAQRNALLNKVIAEFLANHPRIAEMVGIALSRNA